MEKRKTLIVIDGFCNSGKTQLFNYISNILRELEKDFFNKKKFNHLINKCVSNKDYILCKKSEFEEMFPDKKEMSRLYSLDKTTEMFLHYLYSLDDKINYIYTNGLFPSDYVYSSLLKKPFTSINYIDMIINQGYNIINICLLPPSYKYYLKECKKLNEEDPFTEAEYNYIIQLYKKFNNFIINFVKDKLVLKYNTNIEEYIKTYYLIVEEEDTPEILYKKMKLITGNIN